MEIDMFDHPNTQISVVNQKIHDPSKQKLGVDFTYFASYQMKVPSGNLAYLLKISSLIYRKKKNSGDCPVCYS